ncbi:MAG: hypothetical protein CMG62_10130 [Candidatus Marinimicrobia bacterium]|nr:hypothetical protein [Candidatus Neomarinimicrobiota bacterium]|tara:strand:- start:414 stop:2075 length:1662 start_codon:yes stop_codon:yes gene_type:complete
MNEVRLADYLTTYLYDLGIKNVFMLSGTGSIHLDDAFAHQKGMNYICARHEAAAAMMATASAKLDGTVGVVIATTGPGGTNAIGGVTEAWVDSVPILVISGQVYNKQISKDVRSFGVQGFNIIENVKKITKYAKQINDPSKIRFHLEKAIYLANNGRPGPVWLDIPFDIQEKKIIPEKLNGYFPEELITTEKTKDQLEPIIKELKKSKKPLIVFGQGVRNSNAISNLNDMINRLQIPSISARMAIDILEFDHPYYFGLGGMRGQKTPAKLLKECDLIIALGTSFTHAFAGQNYDQFNSKAKIIMVNLDSNEMTKKNLKVDFPLKMDVKKFIEKILNSLKNVKLSDNFTDWISKCNKIKAELEIDFIKSNPINSYYFIEKLNNHTNSNHIFVNDAGSANYICSQGLKIKKGQRELTSGAFYSMGVAVPLSIGASTARPNSQVIAITGDGSIELNIQELRTISINNLNIKLFIINNGGYASIRKSQDDMVGGRYTDDEEILNFSKVADAFELPFYLIDDYKTIDSKLQKILKSNDPALIEIVCDPNQEIYEVFSE